LLTAMSKSQYYMGFIPKLIIILAQYIYSAPIYNPIFPIL